MILVNFYILAIYCHPEDKGLGTSTILKILVILGLTLAWA
jgi:LMBR1 domain-containing protein 1